VGLAFALKISNQFSRVWAFSSWGIGFSLICIARLCAYYCIHRWAKAGLLTRNIAILGAGEHGRRLVQEIQRLDEPWNTVVGVFDDRSTRTLTGTVGYSVMGTVEDLCSFERDNRVDEIIVSLPWRAHDRLLGIIERIRELPVRVRIGPDFIGFRLSRRGFRCSTFCGAPTLEVVAKPITGWDFVVKLLEDKMIASLLIVLFLPLMALIAALIKLDSRGPVLFRQNRYGFNNQVFPMLKFRTMYHHPGAEQDVPQAQRDDPRVTRTGRWLRRTSLDELPQLFNVIQGTMSLVGPRPHAVPHNEQYAAIIHGYYARHRTKPGVTGWAQVKGFRGETEIPEKMKTRVELDIYYVEHWSLLFDLQILAMTPFAVFTRRNAY
jgi:Undecaprenyl-phosphate glucose phosphotransferase